jgi:hypothetical protein
MRTTIQQQKLQKEIAVSSLLYTLKLKTTKEYNQALHILKPVLKSHASFWSSLHESEQNAKGFLGWLNHLKMFYHLIESTKYKQQILDSKVDMLIINKGKKHLIGLKQVYRMQQRCIWENKNSHQPKQYKPVDLQSQQSDHIKNLRTNIPGQTQFKPVL